MNDVFIIILIACLLSMVQKEIIGLKWIINQAIEHKY